jgi:uncharacterized membrane protein (DUF373 family)
MRLRDELQDRRLQWESLFLYERFETVITTILTLLMAVIVIVATWQLILSVAQLSVSHLLIPQSFEGFQAIFGMIFTVLIALEFKHTLLVTVRGERTVVQVQSVVLVAVLALVRKFIILDVNNTAPALYASLAFAVLALGVVYWLIRRQDIGQDASRAGESSSM